MNMNHFRGFTQLIHGIDESSKVGTGKKEKDAMSHPRQSVEGWFSRYSDTLLTLILNLKIIIT